MYYENLPDTITCPYCETTFKTNDLTIAFDNPLDRAISNDIECPNCEVIFYLAVDMEYIEMPIDEAVLAEEGYVKNPFPDHPKQQYFPFTSREELKSHWDKYPYIKKK